MFKKLTLEDFNKVTASSEPTPGGGSIAASNGAIAFSLAEMVAALSLKNDKYKDHHPEFVDIQQRANELRKELLDDIDNDANSFNEVMMAFKMPKETSEDKAVRSSKIQEGYKYAASVPLNIAEKILENMGMFDFLIEHGNKNAVTDALVGLMTARTAVLSSLLNTKINLSSIKDKEFVDELSEVIDRMSEKVKSFELNILDNHI